MSDHVYVTQDRASVKSCNVKLTSTATQAVIPCIILTHTGRLPTNTRRLQPRSSWSMPRPVRLTRRRVLLCGLLLLWRMLRPARLWPCGLRPRSRRRRVLVLVACPLGRGPRGWLVGHWLLLRRLLPVLVLAGIVVGWVVGGRMRQVVGGPTDALIALRRWQRLD